MLRRLTTADRAELDAFLLHHRASSMFLCANLHQAGVTDGPEPFQGLYAGSFRGEDLIGVAAHYWNGNIIMQAPEDTRSLVDFVLSESGREVVGILGPWAQVQAVQPETLLDTNRLGKVVPEYLYTLEIARMNVPPALNAGSVTLRVATEDDLPTLVAWRRVYDRITMGFPEQAIDDHKNADMFRRQISERCLWVLEDAGSPVAMTAFSARLPDCVQVGGVFTDEKARGKGHARSAVAASLQRAQTSGVRDAILFTEVTNVPAQKAYEALGFERAGDYGMVVLDPS